MPIGFSTKGTYKCRQCKETTIFSSISELRHHQYAKHDMLKHVLESRRKNKHKGKWTEEQKAKFKATIAVRKQMQNGSARAVIQELALLKQPIVKMANKQMTVLELLRELKTQAQFLNNVVQLLEGYSGITIK